MNKRRSCAGLTLLELLTYIATISILTILVASMVERYNFKNRAIERQKYLDKASSIIKAAQWKGLKGPLNLEDGWFYIDTRATNAYKMTVALVLSKASSPCTMTLANQTRYIPRDRENYQVLDTLNKCRATNGLLVYFTKP